MRHTLQVTALSLIVVLLIPINGASQQNSADETLSPYFFIENGDPHVDKMPLKSTDVDVTISGVIANVSVTQQYKNSGNKPINASYIFPASTRAAVHGMEMRIGDKIIKAKIKEKEQAKIEYNEAKAAGKSASLLEQKRPNVFSMSVANIMPGDIIEIELHYTELLIPTDGIYEFVYPTVVGPRYSGQPESSAPQSDKWIKNPYLKENAENNSSFSISTKLSSGIPIQDLVCHTHKIQSQWESENLVDVSLSTNEKYSGNRDFILSYRLTGEEIQSGLMMYEGDKENFFLLMAQPPKRVEIEDIPTREYIFVVDVSGSMNGFPLSVTKELLRDLIGNLRPTDMFNVILFAGVSNVMSNKSLPATTENINKAIYTLDRQEGGGGTELYSALERSISLPRDENVSRSIVLVTDGYISAEKETFKLIHKNLNNTNLFAFGIGSSVNRYLIEGLAKAGQGEPFIVTNPQMASTEAKKFRKYIQTPVLTNIEVSYNGFKAFDVEPKQIPDLLAERPIILFGKWRGKPNGTITIKGMTGNEEYIQTFSVPEIEPLKINKPLEYLWARNRIAKLSDFNFNSETDETKREITSLGLTYNLLTKHTSFIAVHDEVRNVEEKAKDVKQPLPLPKGVSNFAVGGSMSSVPEPEMYLLILGMSLMFAFGWYRKSQFKANN